MIHLPSSFWKCYHFKKRNKTIFYQRDHNEIIAKTVSFCNSLIPVIIIYDKEYKFNVEISTMNELQILIEIINCIEKCSFMDEKCIVYFEESYLEFRNQMQRSNYTRREIISYISKTFQNTSETFQNC